IGGRAGVHGDAPLQIAEVQPAARRHGAVPREGIGLHVLASARGEREEGGGENRSKEAGHGWFLVAGYWLLVAGVGSWKSSYQLPATSYHPPHPTPLPSIKFPQLDAP